MKNPKMHVEADVCCQQFATPGMKKTSLKLIMTYYYDGPTAGLFKCELCGKVYKFNMVDWDDKQEVRIHALIPMAAESFTQLEELTAKHGPQMVGRKVPKLTRY